MFESSENVNVVLAELVVVVPEDELVPDELVPELEEPDVLVPGVVVVPEFPVFHVVVLVPDEDELEESDSLFAI